jgi:hypothetical protein
MFDENHDIPSAEAIHLSKLCDGIVTTDLVMQHVYQALLSMR